MKPQINDFSWGLFSFYECQGFWFLQYYNVRMQTLMGLTPPTKNPLLNLTQQCIFKMKILSMNIMVPAGRAYNMHHNNQLKGHMFLLEFSFWPAKKQKWVYVCFQKDNEKKLGKEHCNNVSIYRNFKPNRMYSKTVLTSHPYIVYLRTKSLGPGIHVLWVQLISSNLVSIPGYWLKNNNEYEHIHYSNIPCREGFYE